MQTLATLSDQSFRQFCQWLYQRSGIYLSAEKKQLVSGRLQKRLRELQLASFEQYLQLISSAQQGDEQQIALNLLTTNETFFFREEKHFDFLRQQLKGSLATVPELAIWSAAASTGEEAYSLAMLLTEQRGLQRNWRIVGTDINTRVLEQARNGVYPIERAQRIPQPMLKQCCLKGTGKDQGLFRFRPELRQRLEFRQANLMRPLAMTDKFDVILLRNVLIYFELQDKQQVVANVLRQLKPGGLLLVGHSESIHGYDARLQPLQPSCYRWLP